MSFSVVKASLKQFCKDDYMKSKLNDIVINGNKIMFEAYCFANMHVLRCLDEGNKVPQLNQAFYQSCCAIVSTFYKKKAMEQKNKDLMTTFELYKLCRPEKYKVAYRDNITIVLNYIAIEMATATTNHLTLNFYKRFNKYLKSKYPNTTPTYRYEVCKAIYEKTYVGNDELVLEYRKKLGDKPPYENNIKNDPSFVLSVYKEILTFRQENNERLFSLLPHKGGFQMSYITVDRAVLRDIIVGEELIKTDKKLVELRKDIDTNSRPYWETFFNIKDYETVTRRFDMFKTDGKTVSVVLNVPEREVVVKPKKGTKKTQQCFTCNIEATDNVIGIDPGLRYTFVGYNNNNEVVKCSGKHYYHQSGVNHKNYKQQRCYKRNQEFMDFKANMPSPKTDDIAELQEYIKYALKGLDKAFEVHYTNPFRKWRFKTYIQKQKTFNAICRNITKKRHMKDDTIKSYVGFGDWSNPKDSIIKGHKRGPVLEIKKTLKKWCKVIDVDEFRTSKLCCCCSHCTQKVCFDGKEVNSVLRCTNNECGITIDRDINGSKNIYMLFKNMLNGLSRPTTFCR